jgi:hypothetical protein
MDPLIYIGFTSTCNWSRKSRFVTKFNSRLSGQCNLSLMKFLFVLILCYFMTKVSKSWKQFNCGWIVFCCIGGRCTLAENLFAESQIIRGDVGHEQVKLTKYFITKTFLKPPNTCDIISSRWQVYECPFMLCCKTIIGHVPWKRELKSTPFLAFFYEIA